MKNFCIILSIIAAFLFFAYISIDKVEEHEYADGHKEWYLNGKLHREDGPAIELANGHKKWYLNDV